MSNDLQVTMFLRPDTWIATFDHIHPTMPDLRIVGVHIGDVDMHIATNDDLGLSETVGRLIVALTRLRDDALLRLPEPPEPAWLHETAGWSEPELREAAGNR